ncbi:MAG: glycosyltransferase family 9 protein [Myxococcota bacterium]
MLERVLEAHRLLVVRLDNIGDVIMLGPALRALRKTCPKADISLLCSPAGSTIAGLLPEVDELIVERTLWQDAGGVLPFDPDREQRLVTRLKMGRFDAAFVFTSFSQSPWPPAYACYLAGIPVRVGQPKDFGGSLLSHRVEPPPDHVHQVDRNLSLLRGVGVRDDGIHMSLSLTSEARAGALSILERIGVKPPEPFVLLAPAASCQARSYAPSRFKEVARIVRERSGLPVLVVGSERDAATQGPLRELAQEHGGAHWLVGSTTVPELCAIISRASVVVTNNSGPLHMADAFCRPQVVLYSGTDLVSHWEPRRSRHSLLRVPTPCTPCYRFSCPLDRHECLDLSPEFVAEEVLSLLPQKCAVTKASQ